MACVDYYEKKDKEYPDVGYELAHDSRFNDCFGTRENNKNTINLMITFLLTAIRYNKN